MSSASFPSKMLKVYVVTIPKPGKDPTTPFNFWPILLLNTDVKLYAKILAHRLLPILPILINWPIRLYLRGTGIGCHRVINIIQYAKSCQGPSPLLYLDAEKAFDRIHWGYITHTLKRFGFGGPILSAILALIRYLLHRCTRQKCYPNPSTYLMEQGRSAPCPPQSSIFS